MTDFISKEKRSKVMSAIRSKGNKTTELATIKVFRENKIVGWRRNYKLQSKPDFVFPNSDKPKPKRIQPQRQQRNTKENLKKPS